MTQPADPTTTTPPKATKPPRKRKSRATGTKIGRPRAYTEVRALAVLKLVAEAKSLRTIAATPGMPPLQAMLRWMDPGAATFVPSFRERYMRAKEVAADVLADECIKIADDAALDTRTRLNRKTGKEYAQTDLDHIQRSRLMVDTRKWVASKLAPQKYGERLQTELTGPGGGPIQTVSLVANVQSQLDKIRERIAAQRAAAEAAATPPDPPAGQT